MYRGGETLRWWQLVLLEVSLVLATSGLVAASSGGGRVVVWIAAAAIQMGLVVEAVRAARRLSVPHEAH